jgi:hypothetical protein
MNTGLNEIAGALLIVALASLGVEFVMFVWKHGYLWMSS